jgi:enoyl-CoA hydratase
VAQDVIRYELRDAVAVLHFDDGKANAFSHDAIESLHAHLDRADKDAKAVLLVGRPGRFSGGFDLAVMRSTGDAVRGLVTAGAELFLRMFELPQPIAVACTGHAVAAGALALLTADARIGAQGDFKIGLNEVGIGMTLPIFGVELARHRLSKRHFQRATIRAELYTPDAAVDAGFLDRVTSPESLLDVAFAEAEILAQLPQPAFANTKASVRAATLAAIRATLEEDMRRITQGPTGETTR